jgi:hypothetical protein
MGEPDGIDATMQLFRVALGKIKIPKNTIISHSVYNIGGALNRNSTTRANQDGPEIYGFRGRNYDLNRDLLNQTREIPKFSELFHKLNPDVLDNHVSNGADYQYKLTYIMTTEPIRNCFSTYLDKEMMPSIVDLQKKIYYSLCKCFQRNTRQWIYAILTV